MTRSLNWLEMKLEIAAAYNGRAAGRQAAARIRLRDADPPILVKTP